jgi:hypothetical protein
MKQIITDNYDMTLFNFLEIVVKENLSRLPSPRGPVSPRASLISPRRPIQLLNEVTIPIQEVAKDYSKSFFGILSRERERREGGRERGERKRRERED